MSKIVKCIVEYGNTASKISSWSDWFEYAISLANNNPCNKIYVSIKGDGFKGGKVRLLSEKYKMKIYEALESDNYIEHIEVYSLPTDYKQAAFDYDIYLSKIQSDRRSYVQVSISLDLFEDMKLDTDDLQRELRQFIVSENHIVFEMDVLEFPPKYIELRSNEHLYKSLNIIQHG